MFDKPNWMGYEEWNNRKYCSNVCRFKYFHHTEKSKEKLRNAFSLEKHPQWKQNNQHKTGQLIKILIRAGRNINICEMCKSAIVSDIEDLHRYKIHIHHKDKNKTRQVAKRIGTFCCKSHKLAYEDFIHNRGKQIIRMRV